MRNHSLYELSLSSFAAGVPNLIAYNQTRHADEQDPVPHKDFSDLYEKMSGKGESASEAHQPDNITVLHGQRHMPATAMA